MAASAHPSIKHPAPCQHPDKSTSSSSPPGGEGGFELRRLGGFLNTIFAHRKEKHHHHHRPVLCFPSSSWKWRFRSFSTLGRPLGKKMTSFGTAQAHLVRRNKRSVDVTQQKKKKILICWPRFALHFLQPPASLRAITNCSRTSLLLCPLANPSASPEPQGLSQQLIQPPSLYFKCSQTNSPSQHPARGDGRR